MFELTILMKVPSEMSGNIYEEKHKYFFEDSEAEEMFDLISSTIKAARYEIEYAIRIIEDGQVESNED